MALGKLAASEHAKVMKLGMGFQAGNERSKNTFIRDELALIFKPRLINMRLEAHEVGVHPVNPNDDEITYVAVWDRGAKVVHSGFSFVAIGKPYVFEDNPKTSHIAKHTIAVTSAAEFGIYEKAQRCLRVLCWGPGGVRHRCLL